MAVADKAQAATGWTWRLLMGLAVTGMWELLCPWPWLFSSQKLCLQPSIELFRTLSAEIKKESAARVLITPAGMLRRLQEGDQGKPEAGSLEKDHRLPIT